MGKRWGAEGSNAEVKLRVDRTRRGGRIPCALHKSREVMNEMDLTSSIPEAAARVSAEPVVEERQDGSRLPASTEVRGLRAAIDAPLPPVVRLESRPLSREVSRERARLVGPDYAAMVRELKTRYKISIRKWRTHMSGVAYELTYADGRIKRLISAPKPRSPVSAAIFLHEVGHHAIGFRRYSPRCLEEYYVWQWTFREMAARGIVLDPRVQRHYRRSMYHYIKLARRHGQHVPHELHGLAHWPG